ncbi:MAG: YbhB/YbcL family Raf kinase inhibitor-like protein [Acidimicrobiales bacterium]
MGLPELRAACRSTVAALLVPLATLLLLGGCSSSSDGSTAPNNTATAQPNAAKLSLTSSAFGEGDPIPPTYACAAAGGAAKSPPLSWSGVPKGTAILVLVVHDPDAQVPGGFTHLVTAFEPSTTSFAEGASASGGPMAAWTPMCPPSGEHHYRFTLYAFGPKVTLPDEAAKAAIDAIADQALAASTLTGRFAKP